MYTKYRQSDLFGVSFQLIKHFIFTKSKCILHHGTEDKCKRYVHINIQLTQCCGILTINISYYRSKINTPFSFHSIQTLKCSCGCSVYFLKHDMGQLIFFDNIVLQIKAVEAHKHESVSISTGQTDLA